MDMRRIAVALLIAWPVAARAESRIALCDTADPADHKADDRALQDCLDRGGRVVLRPGRPGYLLANGLVLKRSKTVLVSADRKRRARLVALPELAQPLLRVSPDAEGYEIAHVVFDGNLYKRRKAGDCKGYRGFGTNVQPRGRRFKIHHVDSIRALCGSAMEVLGSDYEISYSRFLENGRPKGRGRAPEPWSDGLTLLKCERAWVHHNVLEDNTDIGLISGGGPYCKVEDNAIMQKRVHAFAGLHVFNFEGNGNHASSYYRRNVIKAERDTLAFGIVVGAHPWDSSLSISDAGRVTDNAVMGAMVGLAVDGIERGVVARNSIDDIQGDRGFNGCRYRAKYAAWHWGKARLDPGFARISFHDGCQSHEPSSARRSRGGSNDPGGSSGDIE